MRAAGEQVKCRAARVCVYCSFRPSSARARAPLPRPELLFFHLHAVAVPAVSSKALGGKPAGGKPAVEPCAQSRQGEASCAVCPQQHPDIHLLRLHCLLCCACGSLSRCCASYACVLSNLRYAMQSGAVFAVLCLRVLVPVLCFLCLRAVKSEVCYAVRCCVCGAVPRQGPKDGTVHADGWAGSCTSGACPGTTRRASAGHPTPCTRTAVQTPARPVQHLCTSGCSCGGPKAPGTGPRDPPAWGSVHPA